MFSELGITALRETNGKGTVSKVGYFFESPASFRKLEIEPINTALLSHEKCLPPLRLLRLIVMVAFMVSIEQVSPEAFPPQNNLFQTAFWGTFKKFTGQEARFFLATFTDDAFSSAYTFPFMVLFRPRHDGSSYAYAPKAPSLALPAEQRGTLLEELALALRPHVPENCICVRYDLAWRSQYGGEEIVRPETAQLALNWGTKTHKLRIAAGNHLAPDTVIINLSLTPEQILSRMRATTRNCIRRSYRSEIDFAVGGIDMLHDWYALYKETAKRKGFYYESEEYFNVLFSHKRIQENTFHEPPPRKKIETIKKEIIPLTASAPLPQFHIMTASKSGKLLSGIIIALSGRNAYYMYAGSATEQRELMPNYGLQWEAIRFARSKGCTRYDLMGIPPNGDVSNPMAGLYLFKTGFGGEKVRFAGAWDYPYDEDRYAYFRLEEQMH